MIRALLLLLGAVSFLTTPYIALLPIYAREIFHGDAQALGMLMGCSGLGALIGNIFLASRPAGDRFSQITIFSSMTAGIALMAFAIGFGIVVTAVSTNISLQTDVGSEFRGRVMSLYTVAYLGISPLGSLAAGLVATGVGVPKTLFFAGLFCVVCAVLLAAPLRQEGGLLAKTARAANALRATP